MNTGIQDALNPGRQLAVVCQGAVPEELLETYEAERVPVRPNVLRFTDRAFTIATSRNEAETPAYLRPRRKHRRLGHLSATGTLIPTASSPN
ncbi:FAD-dependent monooxygenase [Streptomyces mirabilis]|uniref:FAD-dependent monooxygenase n=1 Tax=Streptomyces mirabilis TaxID=68239 RepID=UPI0036AEF776